MSPVQWEWRPAAPAHIATPARPADCWCADDELVADWQHGMIEHSHYPCRHYGRHAFLWPEERPWPRPSRWPLPGLVGRR